MTTDAQLSTQGHLRQVYKSTVHGGIDGLLVWGITGFPGTEGLLVPEWLSALSSNGPEEAVQDPRVWPGPLTDTNPCHPLTHSLDLTKGTLLCAKSEKHFDLINIMTLLLIFPI